MAQIIAIIITGLIITIPLFFRDKEKREKIAIIDTGLDLEKIDLNYLCYGKILNFTEENDFDYLGHGTDVFNSAAKYIDPSKDCILSLKTVTRSPGKSVYHYLEAIRFLSRQKIKSLVLPIEDVGYFYEEKKLLRKISLKTKVYVSAGNSGQNLSRASCSVYPACFNIYFNDPNYRVVSSTDGNLNYGEVISLWEDGTYQGRTGTSFAAAIAAAKGR